MMNGRTIDSATCEAIRRESTPFRPTAIATAMEGMIPRALVRSRRKIGFTDTRIASAPCTCPERVRKTYRDTPS